jgi:hypothetical protein
VRSLSENNGDVLAPEITVCEPPEDCVRYAEYENCEKLERLDEDELEEAEEDEEDDE